MERGKMLTGFLFGALVAVMLTTAIHARAQTPAPEYRIVSVSPRLAGEAAQYRYREDILNDWAAKGYEFVWAYVPKDSVYPDIFIMRKR